MNIFRQLKIGNLQRDIYAYDFVKINQLAIKLSRGKFTNCEVS